MRNSADNWMKQCFTYILLHRILFLLPNQQCQAWNGIWCYRLQFPKLVSQMSVHSSVAELDISLLRSIVNQHALHWSTHNVAHWATHSVDLLSNNVLDVMIARLLHSFWPSLGSWHAITYQPHTYTTCWHTPKKQKDTNYFNTVMQWHS